MVLPMAILLLLWATSVVLWHPLVRCLLQSGSSLVVVEQSRVVLVVVFVLVPPVGSCCVPLHYLPFNFHCCPVHPLLA